MKIHLLLSLILAVIVYLIIPSPHGIWISIVVFVVSLLTRVYKLFMHPKNKEELHNANELQFKNLALLFGYMLNQTGNTDTSIKSKAVEKFSALGSEANMAEVNLSDYYDYIQQAIDGSVDHETYLTIIGEVNNTFIYREVVFTQINFLNTLMILHKETTQRVTKEFADLSHAIGSDLGIQPNILFILITRLTDMDEEDYYQQYNEQDQSQQNSNQYTYHSRDEELEKAYSFLNVSPDVTREELKKVQKRLLTKWHPDKAPAGKESEYTDMSIKINNAVDTISAYKGF